jgi:biopolymer transport protein ExbD
MAVVVAQETPGDRDGSELLYFDDERFVLADPAVLEKVKETMTRAAHEKPGQAMVIEADRQVRHGTMVTLINLAASAGIPQVFVATRPADRVGEGP